MTSARREMATLSGDTTTNDAGPERVRRVTVVFAPLPCVAAVTLGRSALAIGRDPEGSETMVLPDDQSSRTHVRIEHNSATDQHVLVDNGSRNGTYLNGSRVERAPLEDGSVIRVGRCLLVFSDERAARGKLAPETAALWGASLRMQKLRGEIEVAAARPFPVLVLGETGTGKERVAQEIHRQSGRRGPFVPLNCSTLPASLAETELFGHTASAFTGATKKTEGLFATADGGTLFLDEVGELPSAVQPKLLRALAVGEVRAVGSARAEHVDVRIVAATHRDLATAIAGDAFRADLFARLSVFTIRVPALRERRDDVLHLARRFLGEGADPVELSARAAEALLLHSWPFNVRELENVLAASAARAREAGALRREHLPPELVKSPSDARFSSRPPSPSSAPPADETETRLRALLGEHNGNVAAVARAMGKAPTQIFRWISRYGIDKTSQRR